MKNKKANQRLDHMSGVAGKIVEKGGYSIQNESDNYINQNGELFNGEGFFFFHFFFLFFIILIETTKKKLLKLELEDYLAKKFFTL